MNAVARFSQFVGNTFAVWVILFAVISFLFPGGFIWIGAYINLLLGIIMFGMGLTLKPEDFKRVLKAPKIVFIVVIAQYAIMPIIALGLVMLFQLPPEIAVGVILVGCAPGGTSSNVMTYLAKGNTALSVTATAVSTILAPVLTPALTLLLASAWLPVSFMDLFVSIVQIVLVPVILGLVVRYLAGDSIEKGIAVLPLVSVVGIVGVVAAVVSANTEAIVQSGLLIFLVVILHNMLGYIIGFLAARVFGLKLADQKATSIEVGMQNSGLAAALSAAHFSPLSAVPAALFSVWHNISGSLIATWMSKKTDGSERDEVVQEQKTDGVRA
ncbi:MAG TPA: bile acid:sodium symporter family protein [Candidatus Salinicoccus stercoripullorum]|uniref:Bile acid:sodium symporter family protein n=1 Tax=Candidatus Salinicoccus stercoripullorum TaxID=2838756 RepID=A0A9D1TZY6_9STAP|nr:bile acid:sodium symporter family protein [Candidatus Salinicoccus stercoripullorum]